MASDNPPGCTDACFPDRYAPTAWVEEDRAREAHAAHTALDALALTLKRGTRFCAFSTRTVRQDDGTYAVPVYRVTHVRNFPAEKVIYYCDDADSKGRWYASVARLYANGLEVLPADTTTTKGD